MDYNTLLARWGRTDPEIFALFRTGSRVYGTAHERSDHDFIAVLNDERAPRDLVFRPEINITVYHKPSFQDALQEHSVFALETLFLPTVHRLKDPARPFSFTLQKRRLAEVVSERSSADYKKAAKTFDDEPEAAKKKLFHSLRVPIFALQLMKLGRISNYAEAAHLWAELKAREAIEWEELEEGYGPLREQLLQELTSISKRR